MSAETSSETSCHHDCDCHAADRASAPPPRQPFTVGPSFILVCLGAVALIAFIVYLFVPLRWLLGNETTMTRSLANARYIGMTLNIFAHDNAGQYPQPSAGAGEANANLVYQQLIPYYLNGHKEWFHLEGSGWTPRPLGEISSGPAELLAGENHYAYVIGLNRTLNPALPLVADGFGEGTPGIYPQQPGVRGSLEGRFPVVIRIDGSAFLMAPDEQGRVLRKGEELDYFSPAPGWLTEAQRPLNPAR